MSVSPLRGREAALARIQAEEIRQHEEEAEAQRELEEIRAEAIAAQTAAQIGPLSYPQPAAQNGPEKRPLSYPQPAKPDVYKALFTAQQQQQQISFVPSAEAVARAVEEAEAHAAAVREKEEHLQCMRQHREKHARALAEYHERVAKAKSSPQPCDGDLHTRFKKLEGAWCEMSWAQSLTGSAGEDTRNDKAKVMADILAQDRAGLEQATNSVLRDLQHGMKGFASASINATPEPHLWRRHSHPAANNQRNAKLMRDFRGRRVDFTATSDVSSARIHSMGHDDLCSEAQEQQESSMLRRNLEDVLSTVDSLEKSMTSWVGQEASVEAQQSATRPDGAVKLCPALQHHDYAERAEAMRALASQLESAPLGEEPGTGGAPVPANYYVDRWGSSDVTGGDPMVREVNVLRKEVCALLQTANNHSSTST